MKIFIGFLIFIILFLVSLLYLQRKDIKKLTSDLKYINIKGLNNKKIDKNTNKYYINELIDQINEMLYIKQKTQLEYERKERESKEVIASISHDLRTPLTSIKGYTDLLYDDMEDKESKEYLRIIKSRIESLNKLISTFYELSKLELKEIEYELEYVDIKEVLIQVIASYYQNFKDRDIEPIINIESGDYKVIGDFEAIKRIFTNLLDNSLKYGNDYFEINLKIIEGKPVMEFVNDVDNMTEDNLERLFERFFILDTSRQSESTGLGLYITKKLLDNMGYKIYAELIEGNIKIIIDWK